MIRRIHFLVNLHIHYLQIEKFMCGVCDFWFSYSLEIKCKIRFLPSRGLRRLLIIEDEHLLLVRLFEFKTIKSLVPNEKETK